MIGLAQKAVFKSSMARSMLAEQDVRMMLSKHIAPERNTKRFKQKNGRSCVQHK